MKHRLMRVIAPLLCLATIASATMAYGQVTTSLSGTVADTSGAVLPGADVVAKADEKTVVSVDPNTHSRAFLLVGNDQWQFPVPIVRHGARWVFDTQAACGGVARADLPNRTCGGFSSVSR